MNDLPILVEILWWVALIAAVAILPLIVYLLHRTLNAARLIEHYAERTLEAGLGIAGNTENIKELDSTLDVATGIVMTSQDIEEHTEVIATVLDQRAGEMS